MSALTPDEIYQGFEQGPIRPPSESRSLLLRITRNCPWNHCRFCPVYKGTPFSIRPVAHVKRDIDLIHSCIALLDDSAGSLTAFGSGSQNPRALDPMAWQAALHWRTSGKKTVFLQDANSLIIKPAHLLDILRHLQARFPEIRRVTSYARSSTIVRIADEFLAAMREAGLNRIHIGMESGSDEVLKIMRKGATRDKHILAGQKIKNAGMELSEYYMPGLGGRRLRETHARETARALNRINPDFIRLRTLAIPSGIPLYEDYRNGGFDKPTDVMMAEEILIFLESLHGITSTIRSDHILNLLPEIDGTLPDDHDRLIATVKTFLSLTPEQQCLFQLGRRLGIFAGLQDLHNPLKVSRVEGLCRDHGITPDNVDAVIEDLMRRFI